MLWRILWRLNPLLLAVMIGCAGVPRVRVETERDRAFLHIPRTVEVQPVELEQEEFQQALRQLARRARLTGTPRQTAERTFQIDPLSGNYLYLLKDKKLVPAGPGDWDGTLTKEDVETAERYRVWCQRVHGVYGDCLGGALVAGRYLDMQGRYMWAMALSKSPVLEEMKKALGDMVNVQALINSALWTLGSMLLILALNPVAPALVAALGVGVILYVGYATLHDLVAGWFELMEAVRVATTFEQIREAGERFGRILGQEAAKAVAMLLLAAIGQTAQGFAATVETLPGSAQVAVQAEEQVGLSLPDLGSVEEIALADEAVTVTVAANAVAMTARGTGGGKEPCVETHHIATVCNDKDASRGGPWTPRFRKIFAKAGMSLEDPANKMPLEGHYGPHPERYHQIVLDALEEATGTCRSVVECREALISQLRKLAKQIATPGTQLNQLVTK
ncbi:MAG: AHH domain-containing protein [Hyalangium sp.]|uniref:AHH domain-containing protein n=1 Tax=Hyalangium sp. TaxID=2028555 RepID=UPI00389AF02A